MAGARIPLPKHTELPEGVYFHPRLPGDSKQIILQVPNEDRSDSETYLVNLDESAHKGWMEALSHSRQLLDLIAYAPHVAYCVTTGYAEELPDLDAPNVNQMRVALARQEADRSAGMQQRFGGASRRSVPPPSRFRQSLMGRGQMR